MNATESGRTRLPASDLQRFARNAYLSVGVNPTHAELASDAMVEADRRGQQGHGIIRLPGYVSQLESGHLNPAADVRSINETASTALIDGDHGLGGVVATITADAAIGKAVDTGVAWVGSCRSGHPGAGGVYAARALEQGLIGIYMAVSRGRVVAPWGGIEPMLGTNPLAIAIPAGRKPAVQIDFATSIGSAGKITVAKRAGQKLPDGWVLDDAGESINDPDQWRSGTLAPMGEHKGYGLSLAVSILAGVLNGVPLNGQDSAKASAGQAFIAVRPDRFGDTELFASAIDSYLGELQASTPRAGFDRVRVPGDRMQDIRDEMDRLGVPMDETLLADLDELARRLGIDQLGAGDD